MKLLYFAWLRERIGLGEEEVAPPPSVVTVADLIAWLRLRGPSYVEALAESARVRCAVNQDFAKLDTVVRPGDEIAFFPPITGG